MSNNADYHAQCGSLAAIKTKDKNSDISAIFLSDDLRCELAENHDGLCEYYIGPVDEWGTSVYWLRWKYIKNPNRNYTLYETTSICQVVSKNAYRCSRPINHNGGHSFNDDGNGLT